MSNTQKEENEQVGGIAGLGAGVIAGAAAGSAIMPILGTFTGALLGGLLGNEFGKVVGGGILDLFDLDSPAPQATYPPPHPDQPNTTSSHINEQTHASGNDVLQQLERLGTLKAQGMISEEEFKAAKARILGL